MTLTSFETTGENQPSVKKRKGWKGKICQWEKIFLLFLEYCTIESKWKIWKKWQHSFHKFWKLEKGNMFVLKFSLCLLSWKYANSNWGFSVKKWNKHVLKVSKYFTYFNGGNTIVRFIFGHRQ